MRPGSSSVGRPAIICCRALRETFGEPAKAPSPRPGGTLRVVGAWRGRTRASPACAPRASEQRPSGADGSAVSPAPASHHESTGPIRLIGCFVARDADLDATGPGGDAAQAPGSVLDLCAPPRQENGAARAEGAAMRSRTPPPAPHPCEPRAPKQHPLPDRRLRRLAAPASNHESTGPSRFLGCFVAQDADLDVTGPGGDAAQAPGSLRDRRSPPCH